MNETCPLPGPCTFGPQILTVPTQLPHRSTVVFVPEGRGKGLPYTSFTYTCGQRVEGNTASDVLVAHSVHMHIHVLKNMPPVAGAGGKQGAPVLAAVFPGDRVLVSLEGSDTEMMPIRALVYPLQASAAKDFKVRCTLLYLHTACFSNRTR